MNWKDYSRSDRYIFEMIDPFDLEESRGILKGVEVSSCVITQGYYTDSRISASFNAIDSNYIDNSLIRIHHIIDDWDYHNELGTFFVKSITPKYGATSTFTFELASMITRISDEHFVWHYGIKNGAYTKTVLSDILNRYNVDYLLSSTCNNTKYNSAKIYEYGENVLSTVFEVCDKMGARLEVNGHGIITIEPYIPPNVRTPIFTFSDNNGTIEGEIEKTNNFYETTNRVGVVAADTVETKTTKNGKTTTTSNKVEVSGYADLNSSNRMSYSNRGRRITTIHTEDNLSPFNNTEASKRAQTYLLDDAEETSEYSFKSIYAPITIGSCVELIINDVQHLAMLKSRDISLKPGMRCTNTFKEV